MLASCADQFDQTYEAARPDKGAAYEYLNDYAPLKEYIADRPDLHLGVGTTVSEYLNKGLVYALTNSNFTETVAGNAMKMASCVSDDGTMDFSTVTDYVTAATDAGLSVYGHTLAWHSQQPNKWLNALIADKEVKIDPNAKVEEVVAEQDWTKASGYNQWAPDEVKANITVDSEGFHLYNPTAASANYLVQYITASNINLKQGETYTMKIMARASADASVYVGIGGWGSKAEKTISLTTDWEEVTYQFTAVVDGSNFVLMQSGLFAGTIDIRYIKVVQEKAAAVTYYEDRIQNGTMEEGKTMKSFIVREPGQADVEGTILKGQGPDGKNCISITSHANPTNTYDTQFFIVSDQAWTAGDKYRISFWYKATEEAKSETQCHGEPGSYLYWKMLPQNPTFTTEWQHYEATSTIPADGNGMKSIAFNLNVNKNQVTYYIADVEWQIEKSGNSIPQTAEEKKDTLTQAMDTWIGGMMEACQGKVLAWDVVNEALSGTDADGDGWYDLQSATRGTVSVDDAANNFYWQDYLGDLDYVRSAVKFAREHFAESGGNAADLKLFVNDYNLESDWDDNRKLKSLIHWIEQWEADGTTHIDGIGSQMHISCYMNETTQASKKEHITKMLELMAATGKLVRISELDMGLVDESGNSVLTANVTEEQHKAMAALYTWVVKEYFRVVPQAQQWGICQWAPTDSPTNSYWRAGMPIGLWDLDYYRKHTYAGFADGLKRE